MADTNNKTELFEAMPVPKAVMTLAVPTVISSLVMVIYNLADTYFVGILNDPIQNAAVTLASPVILAFNAVNNLFGVGSSSMMSRALGRKDYETVRKSSALGFYFSLFFGLLISMFYTIFHIQALNLLGADAETMTATAQYLRWTTSFGAVFMILNVVMAYLVRSEGYALHASIGTMCGCVLNIVLDPFFILPFGLDMGAAGAGCATFISNVAACCYFFILIAVKRKKGTTFISFNLKLLRAPKKILAGICGVGIPAAIQNLLNVTGMTVLNNFMSAYGSDAVAAIGIAQKVNMIPMYIAMGMSQGIMPLIAYNYSSKNTRRMKSAVRFSMTIALIFLVAFTVIYHTASEWLIGIFMEDEIVVSYGSSFLKGMCLAMPFLSIDFMAVGIFQSCGMGKKSLIFAILRKVVLEIPALCILNRMFPMYGLAYAQLCAEVVLAALAIVVMVRLFRKLDREAERNQA